MAYLEASTKFWRIELPTRGKTVTTTYGALGSKGVTTVKDFDTNAKAKAFVQKQIDAKLKKGYATATDPEATSGSKRKAAAPAAAAAAPTKRTRSATAAAAAKKPAAKTAAAAAKAPAKKKLVKKVSKKRVKTTQKAGLSGAAAAPDSEDEEDEDGDLAVDSGLAAVNPKINKIAFVYDGEWGARLALVDPSINSDKYYILQLLQAKTDYYVYRRNGRTGTSGQAQLDGPYSLDNAKTEFKKIFKSKTGQLWDSRDPTHQPANAKHYRYLKSTGRDAGDGTWEYHLTRDPLGKPDGWYPYDKDAGEEVEELYQTFEVDENTTMSVRYVHSESSGYTYKVDLSNYTQTNTSSGKSRPIRRVD